MTDRVKGLSIILRKDIREDDVEPLIMMLRMFPFVADVTMELATSQDYFVEQRVKQKMREDVMDALNK